MIAPMRTEESSLLTLSYSRPSRVADVAHVHADEANGKPRNNLLLHAVQVVVDTSRPSSTSQRRIEPRLALRTSFHDPYS